MTTVKLLWQQKNHAWQMIMKLLGGPVTVHDESKAKVCMGGSFVSSFLTIVDVLGHILFEIIRLDTKIQTKGLHHL